VILAAVTQQIVLSIFSLLVALLVWDHLHTRGQMRRLAQHIATGDFDAKLEVQEGAWGALCHSVNGLLQQQRLQRQAQTLLPILPTRALATMVNNSPNYNGLSHTLTVLIVGYAGSAGYHANSEAEYLHALRKIAVVAQQQVETHNALLERLGDVMLLVFGAFDDQPATTTIRSALDAAKALRAADDVNLRGSLAICLASGAAQAITLPGLGYTVVGDPVKQALRLYQLATGFPEYTLLCSEETYLALRYFDTNAWHPTNLRLIQPHQPPQMVYALAN
jgi:class 3 adenylate cyclase